LRDISPIPIASSSRLAAAAAVTNVMIGLIHSAEIATQPSDV
jgi:hypothetical protein